MNTEREVARPLVRVDAPPLAPVRVERERSLDESKQHDIGPKHTSKGDVIPVMKPCTSLQAALESVPLGRKG